jgi:hypothetical protein
VELTTELEDDMLLPVPLENDELKLETLLVTDETDENEELMLLTELTELTLLALELADGQIKSIPKASGQCSSISGQYFEIFGAISGGKVGVGICGNMDVIANAGSAGATASGATTASCCGALTGPCGSVVVGRFTCRPADKTSATDGAAYA